MRRHEIVEEDWERIKDMLPGQPGDPGVTARDNRTFINAILWIGTTGAPGRDLPERFGPWGSACVTSASWPPVRRNSTGLPRASTRMWILVLNPPTERPNA